MSSGPVREFWSRSFRVPGTLNDEDGSFGAVAHFGVSRQVMALNDQLSELIPLDRFLLEGFQKVPPGSW
jgi:hypothetical protein